ncbi:MAG: flagellar biosynthesis protein FlhB [Tagaea sp.]
MAEEAEDDSSKTEEPTGKRLEDAREKGQIALSREITHWMMFSAATLSLAIFADYAWRRLTVSMLPFFARPHDIEISVNGLQRIVAQALVEPLLAVGPLMAVLVLAAIGAQMLQNGLVVSGESLKPNFTRLSPVTGLKRMFSANALVEFVKGLIKIAIVAAASWYVIADQVKDISRFIDMDPAQLGPFMGDMTIAVMIAVISVMTAIAALDFFWQRFQHTKRLRMTKQEIKEEYKQAEGDPVVKGRIKQLRMERARKRMMAEVPKATVVVTNPTHFAVALRYDEGKSPAPVCVAKGVDLVALRIRELARDADVPIVENPPLARALHASVDLEEEIKPEQYKAVAEVISYVFALRKKTAPRPDPRPPAR